jgi:hypothetical protein
MRKLTITIAASTILAMMTMSANALTGPNSSKALAEANYTPRHEAACQGPGPFCGPGFVRACGPYRCWCRPCR